MRFSVLVPVYNTMDYLPYCLGSLDCQTFRDFEVILVDDGSSDCSPSICDEYCRTRPFAKVLHKDNQGPFLARVDALSLAAGEYCLYLDSDDALHDRALETIDAAIRDSTPDVVLFGVSRCSDFSDRWDALGLKPGLFSVEAFRESVAAGCSGNLANKAIRAEIAKRSICNRAFKGFSYGEDWLQVAEIASHVSTVFFVDESLYFYRDNQSSTTANYRRENFRQILVVLQGLFEIVELWGAQSRRNYRNAIVTKIYEQMATAALWFTDETALEEEYMTMGEMIPEQLSRLRRPLGLKNTVKNVVVGFLLQGRAGFAVFAVKMLSKTGR